MGWVVGAIAAAIVVWAMLSSDPRDAWALSEAEEDLRWEKARRERERAEFTRKILGE